jgi:rod shape determining protein RodA
VSFARFIRRDLDHSLIAGVLAMTMIGVTMIYSATYDWDLGAGSRVYQKQMAWTVVALAALILTVTFPLKFYYAFAYILYAVAMILLVAVLELGDRRWFNLGPIHVQPSELSKIATVFAVARCLSRRKLSMDRVRTFVLPVALVALPTLLVFKQPDLGTALVFGAILLPMLYWAGLRPLVLFFIISPVLSLVCAFHYAALGLLVFLLVGAILVYRPRLAIIVAILSLNLSVAVGAPYLWDHKIHDYQKRRILTFLNPDIDKLGAGYQVIQSRVAIGSGGLTGKGFLEGTQTKLAFLPEQHTDFIFSVVGEEFGFAGGMGLLALYLFVIWRGLRVTALSKSRFASLAGVGLVSILVFHVFVNVGMTIGVMPVTGLPLPFLSYGGSPLVMNMVLVGFLLNIHARRHEYF